MSVLIDKSYNFGFGLVHSIENPSVVFFKKNHAGFVYNVNSSVHFIVHTAKPISYIIYLIFN